MDSGQAPARGKFRYLGAKMAVLATSGVITVATVLAFREAERSKLLAQKNESELELKKTNEAVLRAQKEISLSREDKLRKLNITPREINQTQTVDKVIQRLVPSSPSPNITPIPVKKKVDTKTKTS